MYTQIYNLDSDIYSHWSFVSRLIKFFFFFFLICIVKESVRAVLLKKSCNSAYGFMRYLHTKLNWCLRTRMCSLNERYIYTYIYIYIYIYIYKYIHVVDGPNGSLATAIFTEDLLFSFTQFSLSLSLALCLSLIQIVCKLSP